MGRHSGAAKFLPKNGRLFTVREVNRFVNDYTDERSCVSARAQFAFEWLRDSALFLQWEDVSFDGVEAGQSLVLGGREWSYLRNGEHYDDDPWNERNLSQVWLEEGLYLFAKCPRHGGRRRSRFPVYTPTPLDLNNAFLRSGEPFRCSLCSGVAVYKRNEADPGSSQYCANCCERRFRIDKKHWWKKPKTHPVYKEADFRASTRSSLTGLIEWAKDAECDRCVTWTYANGGQLIDTYAAPHRTYKR